MAYNFKVTPELVWAFIVAITTILGQVVAQGQPGDWKIWGIGLLAGVTRAIIAVILSKVGSSNA